MGRIKSIFKSPLFILYWIVASELIGFGMIIPVLPQIVTRFQTSGVAIGVLLASYSLVQFFAAPILGSLSDTYGRKPILVLSKVGSMCGYLIFAVASSYGLLLLSRIVDGLSGGNISVARAYAADVTGTEERSKGMAVVGIGFATGFIIGPALGGFLYGAQTGFLLPGLVAAGLSLASAILTILFLPESNTRTTTEPVLARFSALPKFFSSRLISTILFIQLGYMVVFSGFETSISVFMQRAFSFTEQHTSMMFLYLGILALLFQGYFSRKKVGNVQVMIVSGLGIGMLSFVGIAAARHIPGLLAALALLSIAICLVNVFLPAYFSSQVDPDSRGLAMGVFESIGSISRVIGPILVYFAFFHHLRLAYILFALVFGIASIVFCLLSFQKVSQTLRN